MLSYSSLVFEINLYIACSGLKTQPHYEVPNENQKIIEKWATEGLERLT